MYENIQNTLIQLVTGFMFSEYELSFFCTVKPFFSFIIQTQKYRELQLYLFRIIYFKNLFNKNKLLRASVNLYTEKKHVYKVTQKRPSFSFLFLSSAEVAFFF